MKVRLCRLRFGFVLCMSIILSDVTVSAVTNNTNVSTSALVQSTSKLISTSLPSFIPLPLNPQDHKNDTEQAKRRAFVRNMMKEAWAGYVKCSWGKAQFKPLHCESSNSSSYEYVLTAMPTLWIMGLRDEFNSARDRIAQMEGKFPDQKVFFGAMLSCYALTGYTIFLDIVLKLAPDFIENGHFVNIADYNWQNTVLEFPYLTHLTGNQSFAQFSQQMELEMEKVLQQYRKTLQSKLYITNGDYFLLKVKRYLQSNQTIDKTKIEKFYRDIEQLKGKQHLSRTALGLWYFGGVENTKCGETRGNSEIFLMHMCSIGSILSLEAQLLPKVLYGKSSWRKLSVNQMKNVITHWEMAKNINDTCYLASKYTSEFMIPFARFIPGSSMRVDACYHLNITSPNIRETIIKNDSDYPYFHLDSYQLLESYFTLWRATGAKKYRNYAWEMANKIYKYSRVPNGYVSGPPQMTKQDDDRNFQPPLFFTTLSYLYLMFTPDSYLPLDKWVLNPAGHPLPICGSGNPAYSNVKC